MDSRIEYEVDSRIQLPDDHVVIRHDPVLPDKRDAEFYANEYRREGVPAWVVPVTVTPLGE